MTRSEGRAVAVLLLMAAPALAQEYLRTVAKTEGSTGRCVTWNTRTFTYHAALEGNSRLPGEAAFDAIDAAFGSWQALSDTCSDFTFIRGARLAAPKVGQGSDRENVVVFRETECGQTVPEGDPCWADRACPDVYGCWAHASAIIGLTTVTYSKRTGVAVDADIELNAADFLFTTVASPPCAGGAELANCVAYDVQNTLTHEIGHAVGFDHVPGPASTMAATAPLGETSKRIIDLGTANGFCATYPRGQPPTACDEQLMLDRRVVANTAGTFGCTCQSDGGPALGALLLLWSVRRRRRRLTPIDGRLQG